MNVPDALVEHYPPHVVAWAKEATWQKRTVRTASLHMKPRPGKPLDAGKVRSMLARLDAGDTLPPVTLVDTGKGRLKIADGFHRAAAQILAGRRTLEAHVAAVPKRTGPWSRAMHAAKLNT